jgi:hypothetical protein
MTCVTPSIKTGNVSLELSINGEQYSVGSGVNMLAHGSLNVTASYPTVVHGGSQLSLTAMGVPAGINMFCGVGGATSERNTWLYTGAARTMSGVSCALPLRSNGMHAVEISMSEGGEMTRSGIQVEYVAVGRVSSIQPSIGSMAGGTMVTVAGEGFVAGRTVCQMGSTHTVIAEVLSSSKAHCAMPAGVPGRVSVEVATNWQGQALLTSDVSNDGVNFEYHPTIALRRVYPAVVVQEGGNMLHATVAGLQDGSFGYCQYGQRVVVRAEKVGLGKIECLTVAGVAGNATVEVSVNGYDFTQSSNVLKLLRTGRVKLC